MSGSSSSKDKESKKKERKSTSGSNTKDDKATSSSSSSSSAATKQQKEHDEQEAKRRGITYKEVRQERRQREKTNGSKRSSEPDKLDTSEHNREIKRMRAYSHDETKTTTSNTATSSTNGTSNSHNDQRPRTRSIDVKEEQNLQISNTITSLTVEEWKLQHSITIQQHHGRGASSTSSSNSQNVPIPTPYRTFEETPFSPKIVSLFHQAKFIAPTPIQAQAWPIAVQQYDMICIAKTGSGSYVYQNGCWMMICVLYVVFPSFCSVTTYTCIMFYSLSNHFFYLYQH